MSNETPKSPLTTKYAFGRTPKGEFFLAKVTVDVSFQTFGYKILSVEKTWLGSLVPGDIVVRGQLEDTLEGAQKFCGRIAQMDRAEHLRKAATLQLVADFIGNISDIGVEEE